MLDERAECFANTREHDIADIEWSPVVSLIAGYMTRAVTESKHLNERFEKEINATWVTDAFNAHTLLMHARGGAYIDDPCHRVSRFF